MKQLRYLISGGYAHQLTRSAITLGETDTLCVTVDLAGGTLCLVGEEESPILHALGEEGSATVCFRELSCGTLHVLFIKGRDTYDGGYLTVHADKQGQKTILPARITTEAERERMLAMMGDLLARLQSAEELLDELKHGADVIQ